MMRLNFTALAAVVGLLLSVGGSGIVAYVAVQNGFSSMGAKVSEHEYRLSALEHDLSAQHKETLDYQLEMRAAVAHAVDLLTDMRLQVAKSSRYAK